ncbi:MAG: HupE/UreJ family protein [Phycisphaerae bacterium]|jgi:uncharacterized membrane protein
MSVRLPGLALRLLTVVLSCVFAACASAHPTFSATALAKVDANNKLTLRLRHDALAFALNETPARIPDEPMLAFLTASESEQHDTFSDGLLRFSALTTIYADETPLQLTITEHPSRDQLAAWQIANPAMRLPVKMDFAGHVQVPPGTRTLRFKLPKVLGDVILTVDRPDQEPLGFPLLAGEISPEFDLPTSPTTPASSEQPAPAKTAQPTAPAATSAFHIFLRYIRVGFTHILPGGPDHALFVLSLFLLTPRVKPLVMQITAFTIAHTVTLTLTTLHIFTLPANIVEPVIAATIAFVAIENLSTTTARPWRSALAFLFGLVHGMGFAAVLSEVGLPTNQLATGLIGFSIGVELGHLAVLAAAFGLLAWTRDKPWFRNRVATPLSLVIAAVALLWLVQRLGLLPTA